MHSVSFLFDGKTLCMWNGKIMVKVSVTTKIVEKVETVLCERLNKWWNEWNHLKKEQENE